MRAKHFYQLFLTILILAGCQDRQVYVDTLSRAEALMDDAPGDALALLDSIRGDTAHFSRRFRMRYEMWRLDARNKLDTAFTMVEEAKMLTHYFERHGTPNERVRAYYLLGRAYYDSHEVPLALDCYHDAIERADTTSEDCDYALLSRVYVQASNIFYDQLLIQKQLEYIDQSVRYAWMGKDTLAALESMEQKVLAYNSMGEYGRALKIMDDVYTLYNKYGYPRDAAISLGALQTEAMLVCPNEKMKHYIDVYETLSGRFDNHGNIEKGFEAYYYKKGMWLLMRNKLDSAECYFRKELKDGKDFYNQNAGAWGLAQLYKKTNQLDSVGKYALYAYSMNDSVYSQMATGKIAQMHAMYDYGRNQNMAKEAQEEARKAKDIIYLGTVVFVCLLWFLYAFISREKRKKREAYQRYQTSLTIIERAQSDIMRLRNHETEYESLIQEKERLISQQKNEIKEFNNRINQNVLSSDASLNQNGTYQLLLKQATLGKKPSDEDWRNIRKMVIETLPEFNEFLSAHSHMLNMTEYNTCLLIRLHLRPSDICHMLGFSPSYISKIRANLYSKLFGDNGSSKDFDERIMKYC